MTYIPQPILPVTNHTPVLHPPVDLGSMKDSPNSDLTSLYKSIVDHKEITKTTQMMTGVMNSYKHEIGEQILNTMKFVFLWKNDKELVVKVKHSALMHNAVIL